MQQTSKIMPRFAIQLTGDSLDTFTALVPRVDDLGFAMLGVGDSQSLYEDVYIKSTLAALNSRRIRIGPYVTNPFTRHPAVSACAAATLNEVSGGRAFLGIGGGDSAVHNIGMKPATLRETAEYVEAVRALYRDGSTEYQGRPVLFSWTRRAVPLYVAAAGPKTLRMAGRVADGVVVGTGLLPENIASALSDIEAGARESGRRIEDLDIWWHVMGSLDDDPVRALEDIKHSLTTFARTTFAKNPSRADLPAEFHEPMRRIAESYNPKAHLSGGAGNEYARLLDACGMTAYLARRFGLAGDPASVRQQAAEAHAAGARQLMIGVRHPDKARFLDLWERDMTG